MKKLITKAFLIIKYFINIYKNYKNNLPLFSFYENDNLVIRDLWALYKVLNLTNSLLSFILNIYIHLSTDPYAKYISDTSRAVIVQLVEF